MEKVDATVGNQSLLETMQDYGSAEGSPPEALDHPYNALVPVLDDVNPDDAFSTVTCAALPLDSPGTLKQSRRFVGVLRIRLSARQVPRERRRPNVVPGLAPTRIVGVCQSADTSEATWRSLLRQPYCSNGCCRVRPCSAAAAAGWQQTAQNNFWPPTLLPC